MIKKISVIICISFMLISCGKKNCPTYAGSEKEKCDPLFKTK
tara:strand:- start:55 stop:180 length:126 start_codon:yes stop_codon:yes gene_type:complete